MNGQVIAINQKRFFTLDEAKDLLPVIKRITAVIQNRVKNLTTQLSFTKDRKKKSLLEEEVHEIFQEWQQKVRKLGCEAKGMWLVDFDTGEGYYCWHYPEKDIQYFHGYVEGYRGRTPLH